MRLLGLPKTSRVNDVRSRSLRPAWYGAIAWLLISAGPAAATPKPPVAWTCWYDNAKGVSCYLPDARAAAPHAPEDVTAQAASAPTVAPGGRHPLPPLVGTILNQAERLFGRHISIPLFTEPEDMVFVKELAEAVMCGVKENCTVRFLGSASEVALWLDELEDPALS